MRLALAVTLMIIALARSEEKITVPVFIKLHKVASTTVGVWFNCLGVQTTLLDPYLDLRGCDGSNAQRNGDHATASRTNACCRRRQVLFEGFSGPFSHRVMHLYQRGELDTFIRKCLAGPKLTYSLNFDAGFRYMVVLRHPVELFFSTLNFFGPAALGKDENSQRIRIAKHPETASSEDIRILYEQLAIRMKSPLNPGFHSYSVLFGSRSNQADLRARSNHSTGADAEAFAHARARLDADFGVVGTSEDLPSFLALVAAEMGWDAASLCLPLAHTRRKDELVEDGMRLKSFEPKASDHYRRLYSPHVVYTIASELLPTEMQIYEYARARAQYLAEEHGDTYDQTRATIMSVDFQKSCQAKRVQAASLLRRKKSASAGKRAIANESAAQATEFLATLEGGSLGSPDREICEICPFFQAGPASARRQGFISH